MLRLTLNKHEYVVDCVPLKVLRNVSEVTELAFKIDRLAQASARGEDVRELTPELPDVIDKLAGWMVELFGGQFTRDELLDYYPADRFMTDVLTMIYAVNTQVTEALGDFPTKPAATPETVMRK